MKAIPNHAKQRLVEGKLSTGLGLRQARTADIAAIAKTAGFDWLFIDMEHSSLDLDTAAQICAAALPAGISPIVRVPGKEHHHASRILDNGAQGIVIPHVNSAEEARQAVSHCKYPPIGHRSLAGGLPQFEFQPVPLAEATQVINAETLVIVMVETPEAVECVDEIAAVPGVDVVLIGTNDLCAELGIAGQYSDPRIVDAYAKVIAACRKHKVHPGMGGVYDPPLMEKYIAMGMRFILSGSDLSFIMAGGRERTRFLNACKL